MVKIYCKNINRNDADKHISTKNHEELDDLPRKSIGQQVEAFILAGQNLEMSRRAFFELEDIDDDVDIDELDTGLDEYSDLHDMVQAQQDLTEKFVNINALRKETELKRKQEKKESIVLKDEKVEKKEKVE